MIKTSHPSDLSTKSKHSPLAQWTFRSLARKFAPSRQSQLSKDISAPKRDGRANTLYPLGAQDAPTVLPMVRPTSEPMTYTVSPLQQPVHVVPTSSHRFSSSMQHVSILSHSPMPSPSPLLPRIQQINFPPSLPHLSSSSFDPPLSSSPSLSLHLPSSSSHLPPSSSHLPSSSSSHLPLSSSSHLPPSSSHLPPSSSHLPPSSSSHLLSSSLHQQTLVDPLDPDKTNLELRRKEVLLKKDEAEVRMQESAMKVHAHQKKFEKTQRAFLATVAELEEIDYLLYEAGAKPQSDRNLINSRPALLENKLSTIDWNDSDTSSEISY